MREIRTSRDRFKSLYNESLTLQDGRKTEIINMLSNLVERLISEVTLNSRNVEIFRLIFKMLNYNEGEIDSLVSKKTKKGFLIWNKIANK